MRLIKKSTLTIDRVTGATGADALGRPIKASTTPLSIECSIQPFQFGKVQNLKEGGFDASSALLVYTKTPLKGISQFSKEEADTTTVDGQKYEVFYVENWSRHGLSTDHYKAVIRRIDQNEVT